MKLCARVAQLLGLNGLFFGVSHGFSREPTPSCCGRGLMVIV